MCTKACLGDITGFSCCPSPLSQAQMLSHSVATCWVLGNTARSRTGLPGCHMPLPQGTHGPRPCPGHSLQEEGPSHGLPSDVGLVEQRVEVGEECVAQGEGLPHGLLGRLAETVWLLGLQGRRGQRRPWVLGPRSPGVPASGDPHFLTTQHGVLLQRGRDSQGRVWGEGHPPPATPPPPPYQIEQAIVVPHKGVEGPQLGPAHTQLL